MKARKVPLQMPPVALPHIVDRLLEIGLSEAAGMGVVAISWREIDAWCVRTAIDLLPWESRLIRRMSLAYVSEGRTAESETCPSPWHARVTQREIEAEDAQLRAVLG